MIRIYSTLFFLNVKSVVFCFLFFICFEGTAQLSRQHYIPPITSSDQGNADPLDQYFYISTPEENPVNFKIIPVGTAESFHVVGQVSRDVYYRYSVASAGYSQLVVDPKTTSRVMTNAGYIIEADSPIYVSVRMNAGNNAQAGALVSKGENALGTQFRIGTYNNAGSPQSNYMNFFSFMATEDNTTVQLTNNRTEGLVIQNFGNEQFPINDIELDRGESYVVALKVTDNNGNVIDPNRDGLIGTLVASDKPIVVNTGSANGSFGSGGARDYGIDQIVDLSKIGNEYIFVRADGPSDFENALLVAHYDNTNIWVNGQTEPINPTPLNAGDYFLIEGDQYIDGNMYVRTSQDVFAYQGIGGVSEANQGMFFVPPLSCENRGAIDNIAQIDMIGAINYSGGLTIVTKKDAEVLVNETPVADLPSVVVFGPREVVGKGDYETYIIRGLNNNITVRSSDELYVAYYNINGSASSGSFYSGFPSNPQLSFSLTAAALGNCINAEGGSNIVLNVANAGNFDTFQWYRQDRALNQLIAVSSANSFTFQPTTTGDYLVVASIACSGQTYASRAVPISICPPDADFDGVLDAIDLDNDNDGILDANEADGDGRFDFSTISAPTLELENGQNITLDASFSSSNGSPLSGDAQGGILAELAPGIGTDQLYTLRFSEPLNIKITATENTLASVEDAYFVWRTVEEDELIVVWDPENELLIDSDFDGKFETGVSVFSSSEIRFKINPETLRNRTFTFLARSLSGLVLLHQQNNPTAQSSYFARVKSYDYDLDTDSDLLLDSFDLDSDGDGCFDLVEAGFGNLDEDNNGQLGQSPLVFDLGNIDRRGRYVGHDYAQLPEVNAAGIPSFQSFTAAPQIIAGGQPQSFQVCEGLSALFEVTAAFDGNLSYAWQKWNSDLENWEDLADEYPFSGVSSSQLSLQNAAPIHEGNYRVLLLSSTYACPVASDESAYLNVQRSPARPSLSPLSVFCDLPGSNYLVADLTVENQPSSLTLEWFASLTEDTPLSPSTPLERDATYFAQFRSLNGCTSSERSSTTVYIAPLPELTTPSIRIEQCDEDGVSDGVSLFNLNEYAKRLSNSSSLTFAFFGSADFSSTSQISSPTQYANQPFNDLVFVQLISPFGCVATATLEIQLGASTISDDFIRYYAVCDDSPAENQDGLSVFTPEVFENLKLELIAKHPAFSAQNLSFEFYPQLRDALTKQNQIDVGQPYLTQTPGEQEIWVNIEAVALNTISCIGLKQIAFFYVESRPIAHAVSLPRACDGEDDLDTDDRDGFFPFDTSSLSSDVLQNQTDVSLFFFDPEGILIGNELPNPYLTSSKTITIRAEKNATYPEVDNPQRPCFDSTTLSFLVDQKPFAQAVEIIPQCDNGEDLTDGISPFDTSSLTLSILASSEENQTLSNTLVVYTYRDLEGGLQTATNTLPNPFFTFSQQVTVTLTQRINPACATQIQLDFRVNALPEIDVPEEVIRCINAPPEPIGYFTEDASIYAYQWVYINDADERFPLNFSTPTIFPDLSGRYELTATTLDGTNCSLIKTIRVVDSSRAEIDPIAVQIDDLNQSGEHSVILLTDNLGIGDYEYSIGFEEGPYQSDPEFYDMPSGPFVLYVRDKMGCGVSSYRNTILAYPRFFSPNADGKNDIWNIQGISYDFYPDAEVSIFDRYGRLLKKFNPVFGGWDGRYNGNPMPSTDYWFICTLGEEQTVKGHFSLLRQGN